MPPEAAGPLGLDRCDAGLHLYRDGDWDHCPNGLDDAARLVEEACGEPVTLIEHRSDLTYWTARLRDQS